MQTSAAAPRKGDIRLPLFAIFFASGFTGLVYEVLWLRQLSLLFGSTAPAAATTLAVFFAGLSLGSWLLGERAARSPRPLRLYALLEVGVAVTAAAYFLLLDLYHAVYAPLFRTFEGHVAAFIAVKVALSAGVLLPPAILMGGTFPVLGQHLVRRRSELGRVASLLYAVNTLGGAAGALAAGFWLPVILGFRRSYLMAMGFSIGLGAAAALVDWWEGRRERPEPAAVPEPSESDISPPSQRGLLILAFLSGFAALSAEVLWTRMFAQVLHNSVYSFAIILVTFLTALALGSVLTHFLSRSSLRARPALFWLLMLAGIGTGASPLLFYWITGGLDYVAGTAPWPQYVLAVFRTAAEVMFVPGVLIGSVFPFLLKVAEESVQSPGRVIGRLAAVNTAGSIVGSLCAGFVLLSWLGLWASLRTVALVYFLAAWALAGREVSSRAWVGALPAAALLIFVTFLDPSRLPVVRAGAPGAECIYQVWESSQGIVAVVRDGDDLRLKVDNYYSLGGTAARTYEETQADIPIVIHPRPRSAFFLGLGTGITAGAALRHPSIERVTTCELIADVAVATRKYFGSYINGLFDDPRSKVVIEDGRNYLLGTAERYDVIVSDLFIPWQPGAGSLYSKEHFEAVRRRLKPGGIFAQWLPLYQLSRQEFFTIAHTMLDVFPQVTLWRGDFFPQKPIVALVGSESDQPLDAEALVRNFRKRRGDEHASRDAVMGLSALFYAGDLGRSRDLFAGYPVNTDDRPLIEYSSPVTQREHWGRGKPWFTGLDLAALYETLLARTPPEQDPYLRQLTAAERGYVRAGLELYRANAYKSAGREDESHRYAEEFARLVPPAISKMFQPK